MAAQATFQFSGAQLDTSAIIVSGAQAVFYDLVLIQFPSENRNGRLFMRGIVGASALTGFQISWSPNIGGYAAGQIKPVVIDTDLNTPSNIILNATNNLYLTAATGKFDIVLGIIPGEYLISIKCGGATTLELILDTIGND